MQAPTELNLRTSTAQFVSLVSIGGAAIIILIPSHRVFLRRDEECPRECFFPISCSPYHNLSLKKKNNIQLRGHFIMPPASVLFVRGLHLLLVFQEARSKRDAHRRGFRLCRIA
jgi:hypothetical protein